MYQQDAKGNRQFIPGAYVLDRPNRVRFRLAHWDRSRPVVIDPVLAWSTFAGAAATESYSAMIADTSGNVYLARRSSGALTVEKLGPTGATVLYQTVVGSGHTSNVQNVQDVTVDSSGKVYIVGLSGIGFPTTATAAKQTVVSGTHAYMAVLAATGASLTYSTYLAGTNGTDQANGVAVDSTGKVFVTGTTSATTMPTTAGVIQTALTSGQGAFVAKLDPALSGAASLVYLTYLERTRSGHDGTSRRDRLRRERVCDRQRRLRFPDYGWRLLLRQGESRAGRGVRHEAQYHRGPHLLRSARPGDGLCDRS